MDKRWKRIALATMFLTAYIGVGGLFGKIYNDFQERIEMYKIIGGSNQDIAECKRIRDDFKFRIFQPFYTLADYARNRD